MIALKKGSALWEILGLLCLTVIGIGMLLPALQRSSGGTRALRDGAQLKQAHLGMATHFNEYGSIAPSWAIMIYNGYIVPDICFSVYSPRNIRPADEITLGSYSVNDLYDPSTTLEEITTEAFLTVPNEPWERIGDLLLSREVEAVDSFNSEIVAGVMLVAGKKDTDAIATNFVFADNHVALIPINEAGSERPAYLAMIEADRRARESRGMSEPPDYAALIRAHTAEQHRLAKAGK